jgi:hypothetical protein
MIEYIQYRIYGNRSHDYKKKKEVWQIVSLFETTHCRVSDSLLLVGLNYPARDNWGMQLEIEFLLAACNIFLRKIYVKDHFYIRLDYGTT